MYTKFPQPKQAEKELRKEKDEIWRGFLTKGLLFEEFIGLNQFPFLHQQNAIETRGSFLNI